MKMEATHWIQLICHIVVQKNLLTPFTFQMNKKSSTTRTTNMSRKKSNMRKQENMMKKANSNDKSRTKTNMKKRKNNKRRQQTSSTSSKQKQNFASFAERLKVLRAQVSTNYTESGTDGKSVRLKSNSVFLSDSAS